MIIKGLEKDSDDIGGKGYVQELYEEFIISEMI